MLYSKNRRDEKLDIELFKNPTADFRATPFWAWNCELDKDELCRQIDTFKEMGCGGYHMHARAGLAVRYLGEEFMGLVKACVEHGKKNGMISWLYDEDRCPSGFAGGLVTENKEFRRRKIEIVTDESQIKGDVTEILARFDILLDENKCLKSYKTVDEGDAVEGTLWTVYATQDKPSPQFNNSYVDTLNKKAIERFIEITHEAYAKSVGDEFGKSIPAIFTDEPQFIKKAGLPFADSKERVLLPWTHDLEESYKAEYGESLIEHIPELAWELPDGKISLTRYRYHNHVAERFATAFADTCGKWCDKHGILLTGHMLDEPTLHSQTCVLGDAMRSYRAFTLPGIDMLCNWYELNTAKQCQSAVRQYGRIGMLSELDGVTGWDFDFRGHKLHGDWQAALGVTVRVPHLAWVSMKGRAKRDFPASISYQSSWWKEYSYIEDHFARVATALTRGKPMVRVAVIHPIESYWLHFGPASQTSNVRDKLEKNFSNATEWLIKGSIDFDFICESLFPSLTEKGGAPLKVGEMEYDAVVVPECETLRSTTLERLEAFRDAGGKLIFMGDAPKYADAIPTSRGLALYQKSTRISFNRSSLLDSLNEFRDIEIRQKNGALAEIFAHQLRRDKDGVWLFVAHCQKPENKDIYSFEPTIIKIKGELYPQRWNTQNGSVTPMGFTHENGDTVVKVNLYSHDSLLVFFADKPCGNLPAPKPTSPLAEIKNTASEVSYTLTEPNVLLLDMARFSFDGGELGECEEMLRIDRALRAKFGYPTDAQLQPWVIGKKPSEHSVTLEFEIWSDVNVKGAELALEDAERAAITLNGKHVKYKDSGYYTDKCIRKTPLPIIKKGKNTLRVTLPFGESDNIECMYLLGNFGVKLVGRKAVITELPKTLAFDDITRQGLPFYGGSVKYNIPLEADEEGNYFVRVPHYRAAVLGVSVDGNRAATIAYPPYLVWLGKLCKGTHQVTVEAFISRQNCFGHVHCADEKLNWLGPNSWKTTESSWTYEYRLRCEGIISTPIFYKREN